MATKWSILVDRRAELARQLDEATNYLFGLDATQCNIKCSGCGETLVTEGDFARHFTVPDSRYLNLGSCPVSDALKGDPWTPAKLDDKPKTARCSGCHLIRPLDDEGFFKPHGCVSPYTVP